MPDTGEELEIRKMIQHEDLLRSQRLGWLLALNGFLFTGASFAWDTNSWAEWLIFSLAVAGIGSGVSAILGMRLSALAIRELADRASDADPPVIGMRSQKLKELRTKRWENPQEDESALKRRILHIVDGLLVHVYPWDVLPIILTAVWVAIAFLGFQAK